MSDKVVVYGTLRKGEGNHFVMSRAGGKFLTTEDVHGFAMFHLGGFPGVQTEPDGTIVAEVYEVEDMEPLDWLEGYNPAAPGRGLYNRVRTNTSQGEAWIYTYNGDVNRLPSIPSGDWFDAH